MDKKILLIAKKKFKRLFADYRNFNVVFVDNWRGFRFVFDTDEIKKYHGRKFYNSRLYNMLKSEKPGRFSSGLYQASPADRRFFGPQIFLNCKTYHQYRNCYVNFLLKRAMTKEQIIQELDLIKNLRILYSKTGGEKKLEKEFRRTVIKNALTRAIKSKKVIIREYLEENSWPV